MTREDIMRMALEAGFEAEVGDVWITDGYWADELERFAAFVAAAEREACAKVCDERARKAPMGSDEQCEAEDCAAEIRARGEK